MRRTLLLGLSALALAATPAQAADATGAADLSRFAEFNDDSRSRIDYSAWTDILNDVVLNVPPMDRVPEREDRITTGTRMSTANHSRYRHEANRVIYHEMSEEYRAAISEYRAELEALPGQINFGALSSNEQLAYWFNLHNAAVIEQIMLAYPVRRIDRMTANGTDEDLFEAKILNVAGIPLSLNDIRLRIVYEQWDDPRVIYGFFNGSIGSPEIRRTAYNGSQVWSQLDASAAEFVNALRGVDVSRRYLRVSHIYDEAREFFPNFDVDLRAHLSSYANDETAEQLAPGGRIRTNVDDWQIADMLNGSRRCTGVAGITPLVSIDNREPGLVARGAQSCSTYPSNAAALIQAVRVRRMELFEQGRFGDVLVNDIPTDENGNYILSETDGTPPSTEEN